MFSAAGAPGEGGVGGSREPCATVTFAEATLEAEVRAKIQKPAPAELSAADVSSITSLSLLGAGIHSLQGIECLVGLTNVTLSFNAIDSLEPLSLLPNLASVELDSASEPLDLAPLATAPRLKSLRLNSTKLSDLTPLSQIATLRSLYISGATLAQPESVSLLTQLTFLHSANGSIKNLALLAPLTELETLYLDSTKSTVDHAQLGALVNLKLLSVSKIGLKSLAPITHMPRLVELHGNDNDVTDLTPLAGLANLKRVDLVGNDISSLSPLVGSTGLCQPGDLLFLGSNPINCVEQANNIATLEACGLGKLGLDTDCDN